MVASSFVTARKKLNSELAKVRDELVHQTSGKKGDLMKLEQEVSLKRVSDETCFSLTESKNHVLEFGGRLPHVHLRRYIACLMYKIHIKIVVQVHFKGCFMLEKSF